MTTNTHPYAEILRAIADGHQVQWQDPTGRWRDQTVCTTLHEISSESYGPDRYRIKPRTININGHEVPEPLRAMPKAGTKVFWPSFVSDDLVEHAVASLRDQTICNLLRIGMLHSNHEAAVAHAQALLSFTAKEAA